MTTPREDAIALLLREAIEAYHQTGLIRDHADPNDKTGWNVHDIETCEDPLCVEALAALGAEAETPKGIAETYTEGYEDGHRDAIDEVVTTNRLVDLASPETAEALAEALDRHWMDYIPASRTAICTCGQWQFDSERDIEPGEHFAPFSRHCAEASLAAMWETRR